jgi:hypothetical protein
VVQAHYYFRKNNDKRWLRWIAIAMFTCDLVSTALVVVGIYVYVVPNFGDINYIWVITPILAAECIFATLITGIAQYYFAYQIYCIRSPGLAGRVILGLLAFFGILAFLFGIVCWTRMFMNSDWQHWPIAIKIGFAGCKGCAMLFDIISTAAMCYYLGKGKNSVNIGTRRIVRTLLIFFLHRGALVTIIQTLLFVINLAIPGEMYWLTPHLLVTRLYTNTFFAMCPNFVHGRKCSF